MTMAQHVRRALEWLAIRPSPLAAAQLRKLRRQLPLLYAVLATNAVAVAYSHRGLAPDILTLGVAGALCLVCTVRAFHWARLKGGELPPDRALIELRRVLVLSSLLSVGFVAWALALYRYGGPYEQGQIAFFCAITVIGCIFCLTHLPQAALTVTAIVLIPFCWTFATSGQAVFVAIAGNLALVMIAVGYVLGANYRAFVDLEASKAALIEQHAQTRALDAENARLANTDALTGLPNRRAFFAELDALITEGRRNAGGTFALGILDLDGFKSINDQYGHTLGDKVLVEASRRLAGLADGRALVARLGGDEIAFLLVGSETSSEFLAVGEDACDRLHGHVEIDGARLSCRGSCGIALFRHEDETATSLYDRADYALYHAKGHGRGAATLFSPAHEKSIKEERALDNALLAADFAAEMSVQFQPIVDASSGREVGAEALARWTSPVLGAVAPNKFILAAERSGRMRTLTPILFGKALDEAATWPAEFGLSFNLSAQDITSSETVLALMAAIRGKGVDPRRITLEITETAVMVDFDGAAANISVLRAFGLGIALDDFGVGHSSLKCVHRLPLDKIKIDRGFVQDIVAKQESRDVVRTVIDLCRTLSLECVVEGVETVEQRDAVARLGGRHMQGFLFAGPLSAAELATRLHAPTQVSAAAA